MSLSSAQVTPVCHPCAPLTPANIYQTRAVFACQPGLMSNFPSKHMPHTPPMKRRALVWTCLPATPA